MTVYIVSPHPQPSIVFASTDKAAAEHAQIANGAQRYFVHAVEFEIPPLVTFTAQEILDMFPNSTTE